MRQVGWESNAWMGHRVFSCNLYLPGTQVSQHDRGQGARWRDSVSRTITWLPYLLRDAQVPGDPGAKTELGLPQISCVKNPPGNARDTVSSLV